MSATGSAAVAISVVAMGEAEKAKCIAAVNGYQHETATVAQMQQYAGCIRRIHPTEFSADETIALKVAVVLLFVGVVGGGIYGWRSPYSDGPILGALMGGLGVAAGLLALVLAWAGIAFVLS